MDHGSAKPMCNGLPGMQVRVVNSYAAASLSVSVTLFSKEDFPTEGKPVMMSDVMTSERQLIVSSSS